MFCAKDDKTNTLLVYDAQIHGIKTQLGPSRLRRLD